MTTNSAMPLNNSKVINAWCTYDIANSVYNLCISTVLWPMYYAEVTKAAFVITSYSIHYTKLYEFRLTDKDFENFSSLIFAKTGIHLKPEKKELLNRNNFV